MAAAPPPQPPPLVSQKIVGQAPQPSSGPISLRIARNVVSPYDPPPPTILTQNDVNQLMSGQQPPADPSLMTLIHGTVETWNDFARNEASSWLIDIAHDNCDPRQKRGTLVVHHPQMGLQPVHPAWPLYAAEYEYRLPAGVVVRLSKISVRLTKSVTTHTGSAGTMRDKVMARDGRCWITRTGKPDNLINSHICPKRMGDAVARRVLDDFCDPTFVSAGRTVYDPIFGIMLNKIMDTYFDSYKLGFRHVIGNQYDCHLFIPSDIGGSLLTAVGDIADDYPAVQQIAPPLHGHQVTPPNPVPLPSIASNPPTGLFRWHYLQCVLKHFAHKDSVKSPNIEFFWLPIRLVGDSDDESTDSEADWPSAALDRGRTLYAAQESERARLEATLSWIQSPA